MNKKKRRDKTSSTNRSHSNDGEAAIAAAAEEGQNRHFMYWQIIYAQWKNIHCSWQALAFSLSLAPVYYICTWKSRIWKKRLKHACAIIAKAIHIFHPLDVCKFFRNERIHCLPVARLIRYYWLSHSLVMMCAADPTAVALRHWYTITLRRNEVNLFWFFFLLTILRKKNVFSSLWFLI